VPTYNLFFPNRCDFNVQGQLIKKYDVANLNIEKDAFDGTYRVEQILRPLQIQKYYQFCKQLLPSHKSEICKS